MKEEVLLLSYCLPALSRATEVVEDKGFLREGKKTEGEDSFPAPKEKTFVQKKTIDDIPEMMFEVYSSDERLFTKTEKIAQLKMIADVMQKNEQIKLIKEAKLQSDDGRIVEPIKIDFSEPKGLSRISAMEEAVKASMEKKNDGNA